MLVVSDGSLIAKFTNLLSPSQAGLSLSLMPGYFHQLSLAILWQTGFPQ